MNTNKIAKVWGIFTIGLIILIVYLIASDKVVVGPSVVIPNTTPPEVLARIDSFKVEVIKRDQQIATLQKRYENLKLKDNELKQQLEKAKIKLDSITDFSGDAASLLRELTNIAETPRD